MQEEGMERHRCSVELAKQRLRSEILLQLKRQKEECRNRKSRIIKNKLFRHLIFKKAKIVMFYIAFGKEVETAEMIREARRTGKIIAVPVLKSDSALMKPCLLLDSLKLVRGPYGILEPATKTEVNLEDIDLVIVPGVAFDQKGRRLGRGKGCYDRFLSKLPKKAYSLGLGFDFQILPVVPTSCHDVSVNKVIFA